MNDATRPITGAVLAGGKSTRMGRDKSRLSMGGTTLLERAVSVLREGTGDVFVVGGGDREGVRVVEDAVPGIGPLGGIHAALGAAGGAAVFVVACDMPRLDARVIARQADAWRASDADALVPMVNSRPEPLHAVYAAACLPAVERQIERGDYRVRALFDVVPTEFWKPTPAEARSFANANTPDEWAQISDGPVTRRLAFK